MRPFVCGQLEERVLEVGRFDLHLVDDEAGGGDRLADLLAGDAAGDHLVRRTELGENAARGQHPSAVPRPAASGPGPRSRCARSAPHAALGDQPAVLDDHHRVRRQRQLGQQVAGDQDRAAARRPGCGGTGAASAPRPGRARWWARPGPGSAGSPSRAPASISRCRMPSEKPPTRRRAASARSTSSSTSSTRRSGCRWGGPGSAGGCAPCGRGGSRSPPARHRR